MTDFALTPDWLAARAAVSPQAMALFVDERTLTYGGLDALVHATSHWLHRCGVRRGDHVGVLLPNCLAYVAVVHGLTRLGAVLVPLNIRLSQHEVAGQMVQADCRRLILAADSPLAASTPADSHLIRISHDLAELSSGTATPLKTPLTGLDHLQAIIFTSGTSGRPKGAMLTYANHFHSAVGSAFRLGILSSDRWLACLPLYHVGGLAILLRACLYGTAVVLHDGFDVERVDESLAAQGVTIVSLVPTMLHRLLPKARPGQWPQLRLVLLGGAAAPGELLATARALKVPVATTYGLTEAASQVATLTPEAAVLKPGSVGRPLLFTELRIAGDDGATVPAGTIGEVCVRGPAVFAGYFSDPTATANALRGGELHTGDLGYLDDDGDLWLVQRRSDLIVTGGENVYPVEVEMVLAQHPAVSAVCVAGVAHPEWGQRVAALIVASSPLTVEEVTDFARQRLAGYKVPRLVRFAGALPLTGSGKVSRATVAALLAEGQPVP
jgi:O-succinylbenzoic acid--CoA ligase